MYIQLKLEIFYLFSRNSDQQALRNMACVLLFRANRRYENDLQEYAQDL